MALSLRQIAAKFEEKTAQWLHSLGTGMELVPGRNLALSLRQIAAKFEEKTAQWLHSLGTGGN